MNENNRPKRPEEILAALSAEGNRIGVSRRNGKNSTLTI